MGQITFCFDRGHFYKLSSFSLEFFLIIKRTIFLWKKIFGDLKRKSKERTWVQIPAKVYVRVR